MSRIRYAVTFLAGIAVAIAIILGNTAVARAARDQISRALGLVGSPEPASASVLSEHHLEALDSMAPQAQAEFLLERSMNHYEGANAEIDKRLPRWRGQIDPDDHIEALFRMAINSDDLRVRAAAVEIDIVARKLEKNAGHAHLSTTQRYMHLSPAATEEAIRLLDTRDCGVGFAENRGDIVETRSAESGTD